MKNLLIFTMLVFWGCKKAPKPTNLSHAAESTSHDITIVNYYKVSGIINKDMLNYSDTLIVKLNGNVKINQYGSEITDFYLKCRTNDALTINYNPGKVIERGQIKTAYNRLNVFFNDTLGNIKYSISENCQCISNINQIIK